MRPVFRVGRQYGGGCAEFGCSLVIRYRAGGSFGQYVSFSLRLGWWEIYAALVGDP